MAAQEYAATEVKAAIRDVLQRLMPLLLAATSGGGAAEEGIRLFAEAHLADQLQVRYIHHWTRHPTRCPLSRLHQLWSEGPLQPPCSALVALSRPCFLPAQQCAPSPLLLQALHHGSFMLLLQSVDAIIASCMERVLHVGATIEAILSGATAPASALQAVHKDVTSALQQVRMLLHACLHELRVVEPPLPVQLRCMHCSAAGAHVLA